MLKKIYKNIVLAYPLSTLFALCFFVFLLAYQTKNLAVDASADTLLLENDADLLYARAVNEKYQNRDILVIAFKPNADLLSPKTLATIDSISNELLKLEKVSGIISILNVPLLQSPIKPVSELVNAIPTLKSPNIDKNLVKAEFLESPLYKSSLVSNDFTTTAIVIELHNDTKYLELKNRIKVLEKNSQEYQKLSQLLKEHRDRQRESNHIFITQTRQIIAKYHESGSLFLGGVHMIADDMVSFIKSDLSIYGTALLSLLVIVLWLIFRELRWVGIPIFISILCIFSTTGLLGLIGWEVTVISSNFVSLQLIITISIILHLIVRYRELTLNYPELSQEELVLETMLSKANPSFFAIITTIVGFGSLALCDILPIMNLGWMMSSGIMLSLIISFIAFPALLVKLKKTTPYTTFENSFAITKVFANLVQNHGRKIFFVSSLFFLFSLSGASKLMVENSFIDYFKSDTDIYKGMEVIDAKLGGTTPLDVIVNFQTKDVSTKKMEHVKESLDEFGDEFGDNDSEEQYWFTEEKMKTVEKIHDYLASVEEIGNVQSLATILKIGRTLNNGKDLDNFKLALLYNKIPPKFKKVILDPYVNIQDDEVRFSTRIIDSNPALRRDALIKKIQSDITNIVENKATFRLSNLMILYNNMLQSLFKSQILTLGFVVVALFVMFLAIFKSLKIATIAIVSNIVPMSIIFGLMGWFEIPLDLMTITIAAISLGIGVDDTIHYIHRYLEELKKDNNHIQAMHRSHNSIGFAMYYTTFAIMMGFSILGFSNFIPTIYFGLLTVLVMFMALLGALLLLPRLFIHFKI